MVNIPVTNVEFLRVMNKRARANTKTNEGRPLFSEELRNSDDLCV